MIIDTSVFVAIIMREIETARFAEHGDCFSYALAIAHDEPLLFTGDDFAHTDVRAALAE